MADFEEVSYNAPIEGEITVPTSSFDEGDEDGLSTLDEPIRETVMRDLRAISSKFVHIIYPKKDSTLLRDWDLWGPLVLCVFMAVVLPGPVDETTGEGGPQFAEVFVVVWLGAAVVTLNSQLLGGQISFFQSVCALGYCLFPLCISLTVCWVIVHLTSVSIFTFILRLIFVVIGYAWSIFASNAFLSGNHPPQRKALAIYPICLFYFALAWMILTRT